MKTVSSIEYILPASGERSVEGCNRKKPKAYWVAGGRSPFGQQCLPPDKYPPVNDCNLLKLSLFRNNWFGRV